MSALAIALVLISALFHALRSLFTKGSTRQITTISRLNDRRVILSDFYIV